MERTAPSCDEVPTCDWYRFGVQRCGQPASWSSQARAHADFDGRVLCTRHARKLTRWARTEGWQHQLMFEHLASGDSFVAVSIDVRLLRDAEARDTASAAAT